MEESAPRPPLQNGAGGRELYAESGHETAFVEEAAEVYDPCFGAPTFIPCRFTATSIFSAGFDDGGRLYVTTS